MFQVVGCLVLWILHRLIHEWSCTEFIPLASFSKWLVKCEQQELSPFFTTTKQADLKLYVAFLRVWYGDCLQTWWSFRVSHSQWMRDRSCHIRGECGPKERKCACMRERTTWMQIVSKCVCMPMFREREEAYLKRWGEEGHVDVAVLHEYLQRFLQIGTTQTENDYLLYVDALR